MVRLESRPSCDKVLFGHTVRPPDVFWSSPYRGYIILSIPLIHPLEAITDFYFFGDLKFVEL